MNLSTTPLTLPFASTRHVDALEPDVLEPDVLEPLAKDTKATILAALADFKPISLTDMARVALLDRVEVKYLISVEQVAHLLDELQTHYALLVVEGKPLSRYQTLYFDTPDFALYRRHHMGARNRYKIRSREYVESGYSFLEVKHKTNKRRTIKHRISTPHLVSALDGGDAQFVSEQSPYGSDELAPRLWNRYQRITLINRHDQERVTLDLDLRFAWQGRQSGVPGVVVAEVKRSARNCPSPFVTLMRQHGIRKTSFSKYCVGVSLLYPEVKHNKFKATQRLVAKLTQHGPHTVNGTRAQVGFYAAV